MTIRYIVAPGWEFIPTARGRPASERDPREFTYKDYPGTPFPTVITACPRSGDYVAACQNWREGHLGPTDPQVVAKEAPSGHATVESFPTPGGSSHAAAPSSSRTVSVSQMTNKSTAGKFFSSCPALLLLIGFCHNSHFKSREIP